ncbi:MAG: hypothetical protein MJB12_07255, partial [Firmicutes bacterium]|nr:hypothetical protein [Bacillota bacterium]
MVPDTDFKLMFDNNTIVSGNSGSRGTYVNGGRDFPCSYTVDTAIHGKRINVSIQNDHFAEFEGKTYNVGGFRFDNRIRLYYTYTPPPNEEPSISILSPVHNQEFNRIQTDFRPQIRVYDADNDSLTCKYYINSSSVPEDTRSVSGTSSAKVVTFDPLNMMGLSDGNHSLRFEVTDGEDTVEKTVSFRIVNSPPQINIIYPVKNAVFSEKDAAFVPQISVSDPNGDNLTCRYYIDSKAAPQDTRQISNTATAQTVSFNALDIAGLSQGERTLKFTVTDGKNTVEKTVSIKVDKTAPNLGTVNFASTDRSITVSGSATDTLSGMHGSPYRYTVGTSVSGWTSHTSYTQDSLTPNTEYGVKFEARDNTNHIAVKEQAIYTKAQTPQLSVSDNGVATLQLNVTDNNPASTKYQIKAGSKYVTQTGTLSASPVWITLTNKRITVKGLAPNTTYALRAKAQNGAGIDTSWSSTVNGTSLANPPDLISAVPSQTDIKVSWNSISGVLGYEIEVDGVVKNNGTSTHYTHSGLLPE